MPLTPQQVRDKVFTATRFRAGYSEQEVDDFLEEVEREIGRLMAENAELRRQLEQRGETPIVTGRPVPEPAEAAEPADVHAASGPSAEQVVDGVPEDAAVTGAGVSTADASVPDLPPDTEAEQLLRRTLVLAQRTAEEAIREARKDADKLRSDAQTHFEQQIGQVERDRRALEQQIDQLRAFEREYRTRLRAYLELQLRELDSPGSTQGQVEGAPPSRPPLGPGAAPAGSGPGGPAGTSPGGPAGPEDAPTFSAAPTSESPADAAAEGTDGSSAEDGEGEQPAGATSPPSEG